MNIFELCSVSFDYLENFWELNDNLNNIKDVYIYIYIFITWYCILLLSFTQKHKKYQHYF